MIAAETAAAAAPDPGGAGADDELVVAPGQAVPLTVPEPGGRMEAALDGGVVRPVDGAVVAPGSGEHWLAAVFRDRAGNPSPVRWVRLRVDDRPPTLELLTEPPWAQVDGRAWVAAGARAVARASDEVAGVARTRVACGDAVVEEDGVLYLWPPVEIRVTARDVPAGLATLGWAPPGGPWRDLGAAAVASGAGVELTGIDAVGVRTGVRASLRFADTSLAPGAELRLGAADRVGNDARVTLQGGWRLDDVPPRVEVPRAAVAAGEALTVEVTDDGSGVAAARWRVDGGPWRDLDGPPVPAPPGNPPGERRLEVTAEDRVGNRTAGAWTVRVGEEAGR